jgi:hypothetical protein
MLCRRMQLFTDAVVAIDGSKFKVVNSRDRNLSDAKLKARMQQLEASVARYLDELDRADREPGQLPEARVQHLQQKIATVRAHMQQLARQGEIMRQQDDGQLSMTDPDARSMATHGRGSGVVGYNVQMAVEAAHHLVVAHEVTQEGHDRHRLASTAEAAKTAKTAKTAMACEQLTAIADRGYYKGEQILACEERGIVPLVPKTYTSNSAAAGRFDKRDFRYDAHHDSYQCPADETAPRRMTTQEGDSTIHTYWPSACPTCSVRDACITASHRRIRRWEHEGVLDTMQRRLDHHPEAMRVRRQTVEHVFGTLKAWMGSTHFLTKTKPKVSTEMSLYVLAYNMKRVMQIVGVKALMQAIRA